MYCGGGGGSQPRQCLDFGSFWDMKLVPGLEVGLSFPERAQWFSVLMSTGSPEPRAPPNTRVGPTRGDAGTGLPTCEPRSTCPRLPTVCPALRPGGSPNTGAHFLLLASVSPVLSQCPCLIDKLLCIPQCPNPSISTMKSWVRVPQGKLITPSSAFGHIHATASG